MFTLTIYFIALNVYVEFVLIYRPHPVCKFSQLAAVYPEDTMQLHSLTYTVT